MENVLISILIGIVGIVLGIIIRMVMEKMGLAKAKASAQTVLDEANNKAENIVRQATLDGKQQIYELKLEAEKQIKAKQQEVVDMENKLIRREDNLNFRDETITHKEKQLEDKNRIVQDKIANLDKMEQDLQTKIDNQLHVLEHVSNMTEQDARKEIMNIVEKKMEKEVATYIREKEDEAQQKAADTVKNIIATAIQRYAQEETIERTVSTVTLPSEEMKGRIIGREGRNIKTIEQLTGVDLIIDDTPDALTISCFDPIRREIARLSLETLMRDGRIQPARIEEVVNKVTKEMNDTMIKVGDDAVFKLGIGKIHRELVKLIGRLKYRYSYGQNVLQHSMEVAYFAGIMAAELGLNQSLAKRAGLLHDIGKAIDFEQDGSHIELGSKVAKKYGENAVVINAIESHHGEVPPTSLIANLVAAADALSAARPGARFESMEGYIQRLEQLENIANEFDGVERTYAIQAGREIRVMIQPEKVDDVKMTKIAHDIREKIENEMTYPGQIKVTLIRETRVSEIAK
ncbi:MAG: ribonuclease Y [Firmicutes bacterium]|nr:ribonuclease Y [Erysipelotrichaceae bacterium]MDD6525943.1 ribonuclease Y [Bacillota bacterium]MDD7227409.1 ribonuclease Y [Bacillota bacterium]MDY4972346.1 ribonuclease Y [Erysipelotrichaceae bacterium]MDY5997966.1 ribonuclease Y [Erysipelotrichaceae bacterium]